MKNCVYIVLVCMFIWEMSVFTTESGCIVRPIAKRVPERRIALLREAFERANWERIEFHYNMLCQENDDELGMAVACNQKILNKFSLPLLCLYWMKNNKPSNNIDTARILFEKFLQTNNYIEIGSLLHHAVYSPISLSAIRIILQYPNQNPQLDNTMKQQALDLIGYQLEKSDPYVPNAVELLLNNATIITSSFKKQLKRRIKLLKEDQSTTQVKKNERARLEKLAEKLNI